MFHYTHSILLLRCRRISQIHAHTYIYICARRTPVWQGVLHLANVSVAGSINMSAGQSSTVLPASSRALHTEKRAPGLKCSIWSKRRRMSARRDAFS